MTDKLKAAAEMALEALGKVTHTFLDTEGSHGQMEDEALDSAYEAASALRQALDQLPDTTKMIDTGTDRGAWSDVPDATKWVDELRGDEDLEEPPNSTTNVVEPEPVAWLWKNKDGHQVITDDPDYADGTWVPLYTAPPKREWVGLTDEEIGTLTVFDGLHHVEVPLLADFARAVEAKLKEKNA